ncbi:hypothetical protein PIB30_117333 [Stylosanthes scabra]|uniref:Uncharacterized protein n=1 Tax=Stylosanthes scabra TaxID=79078 RepID=A0ABU6U3T7_9FABA|nr:hypothetical protein [Stylosanthes scabra]
MAAGAGAVPASFSALKTRDSSLGFAKSMDFVRVSDLRRFKSGRTKVSIIRNSNPGGQDIAELQPASPGSPLLGKNIVNHYTRQLGGRQGQLWLVTLLLVASIL